jgi:hypothetical protein
VQREVRAGLALAFTLALGARGAGAGPDAEPGAPPARWAVHPEDGAFHVVLVPDTQHEVDTEPDAGSALEFPWQLPRLERNAAWICEQRDALRIAAVLHLGDFVQGQARGVRTQWSYAERLLDRIESCGIPWLGAMGNHDCDAGSNGCGLPGGGDRASNFQQHVMQRQAKQPEWQSAGPEIHPAHGRCGLGGATRAPSRNGWIRFADRFAALSLDWYPDCAPQDDWARDVLAQHGAELQFVLLGHAVARPGDSPTCAGAGEPGQALRAGRLARAPGVFAIAGGHYVTDPNFACYGSSELAGHRVLNVFSDFQTNVAKSTAGTLVLMRIDVNAYPARPNVCVRQFNPSLGTRDVTEPERCFDVPTLK